MRSPNGGGLTASLSISGLPFGVSLPQDGALSASDASHLAFAEYAPGCIGDYPGGGWSRLDVDCDMGTATVSESCSFNWQCIGAQNRATSWSFDAPVIIPLP